MILELNNIDKSFGEKEVLKGVSFTAEGGKAFGLLGRNGAGKTTSIRIIMNVFPANGGEVLLDGKPIDYHKIGLGYLPEERGLYPKKLVIDQLAYFAELKGMSAKEAVKAVDYWLDRLGMTEYRNKRLDTLSKGNQQKIQLISLFIYMLVFFVLGFLIYAFLYGAIGSTASKLEDISTMVLPVTFLFIIAFMVVLFSMIGGNVNSVLMKVFSYIPFTSPMAMFTRICMSTVAWYEIFISIIILIGSTVGIGVLSAKIYRVGVLLYGTPPKLTKIMKEVFKKQYG